VGIQNKWECLCVLEDGHSRTIRSCEFSPSGNRLASASFDGSIGIWEKDKSTNEWDMMATLEGHENEVKSICWNQNSSFLATSSRDKSVWIWESLPDGDFECEAVLHGHTQDVKFVLWHPKEDFLFSCSYDDTIKIWAEEAEDWHCMATLTAHSSTVWQLAFDSTGSKLISGSDDGKAVVWKKYDVDDSNDSASRVGKWRQVSEVAVCAADPIYSIHWNHDFGVFITGSGDNSIKGFVEDDTASSPDSPSYGQDFRIESAHEGDVNCVRWNPKQTDIFASAGDDGLVKIWRYTPV